MTASTKSAPQLLGNFFWALAIMAISIVVLLNLQPWMLLSEHLVDQIEFVPFAGWIGAAFFKTIGARIAAAILAVLGWVQISKGHQIKGLVMIALAGLCFFTPGAVYDERITLVGMVLWGWVQFVQIMPLLAEYVPGVSKSWQKRLKVYRVTAYGLELLACLIRFPPYERGLMAFFKNWADGTLAPTQWSWANFMLTMATIVSVELVVVFMLRFAIEVGIMKRRGHPKYSSKKAAGPKAASAQWEVVE